MNVVVDSSIWIAFLRGRPAATVEHLSPLLEEDRVLLARPVWVELLAGFPKNRRSDMAWRFSGLRMLTPDEDTWAFIEDWQQKATANGFSLGVADLLIGALAAQAGASVWTNDSDFDHMRDLNFIQLHTPSREG
jgi:predicted nucleic acid-binding protein